MILGERFWQRRRCSARGTVEERSLLPLRDAFDPGFNVARGDVGLQPKQTLVLANGG
jgi:hypothetical protein